MQAQDKPDIHTFYDVYLVHGNKQYFSKRYIRPTAAAERAKTLDYMYKNIGYTSYVDVIEIPRHELPE